MKGLGFGSNSVGSGSPAMTGSMKNGPNLADVNEDNRKCLQGNRPLLIQSAGEKVCEGLRCDLSLLFHPIHIDPESELLSSALISKTTSGCQIKRTV